MGMIKEFREFALKGNVLDLAVGVIIGAAFGKIIDSMIKDIIMPVVGLAGNANFTDQKTLLKAADPAVKGSEDNYLMWGNFITVAINFLILALCVFMIVKVFNSARRRFEAQPAPAPAVPPAPTKEQVLLTEIRDLLASRK